LLHIVTLNVLFYSDIIRKLYYNRREKRSIL